MTVQSVPFLSIIGMALTLIISVGLPAALFIYCRRKLEVKTSSLIFGLIIYYIAAKIFEPFINAAVLNNLGGSVMNNMFIYAVYVGLIATAVEEGTRYLGLKTIIKNVDESNAFFFGLGFCALEALLTSAWPQVSNILNSVLINNGMMAKSMELLQEPDLSATYFTIAPLWETSSITFLLAGIERACIMAMHLCLSLIVFYFIKTGEKKFIYTAVLAHFAVVACSALLGQMDKSLFSVVITAAISCALVVFTQRSRKEYLAAVPMGEYAVIEQAKPLE